jgi:3-oxoacyl-[acyl-carrier protein] reductase
VALVADAGFYVGPPIARLLAARGHDLVVGNPAEGLVDELESLGAAVHVVDGARDLADPDTSARVVAGALDRFGRIDSATAFSGRVVTGWFVSSSIDDLRTVERGCIEAPYHFLRAVVPVMVEQKAGQVLVLTSATAARPTPNAPLYSAARAAGTMLVKNVAAEVARHGVQVNSVGTNFMDFPEFLRASGATDPAIRERIEAGVPMRRLGTVDECAAFCMAFIDGSSGFTTGQFVSYSGGWG